MGPAIFGTGVVVPPPVTPPVTPPPVVTQPTISSFTASSDTIVAGQPTTLSFAAANTTTLMLNPGAINVTGLMSRSVAPATTTTYTLTASNSAGAVSKSLTITVTAVVTPPTTSTWTKCAVENATCAFTGTKTVRYGANGKYIIKTISGGTPCTNAVFGDPIVGTVKTCELMSTTTTPTPPPAVTAQKIFSTQVPTQMTNTDGANVNYELGLQFVSTAAGKITAIRFYKSPSESANHIGRIYSSAGAVLAQVTFTGETASGWQQMNLAAPITIAANATYTVSVTTGNSYYVITQSALKTQITSGSLKSLVNGGVFGPVGARPTQTWESSNYFRDIVFVPN